MPAVPGFLRSGIGSLVLYTLVIMVCIFGAAATDNRAIKIFAFTVLGIVIVARVTVRTRSGLKRYRSLENPGSQELLSLALVRYFPALVLGALGILLVLVAVTDSTPMRVVLLGLCGLLILGVPFSLRELRKLSSSTSDDETHS